MVDLAHRLKAAREERGLSQDALAASARVTAKTISRWENGESQPQGRLLHRVANALGKSVQWLEGGGEDVAGARLLSQAEEILARSLVPSRVEEYGIALQTTRDMLHNHFEPGVHYQERDGERPILLPEGATKLIFALGYVTKLLFAEKEDEGTEQRWNVRGALLRGDKQTEVIGEAAGTATSDEITGPDRDGIPGVAQKTLILAVDRMKISLLVQETAAGEIFGR